MTLPQILWVEQDSAYLPANGIDRSSYRKHVRVDKTFVVHASACPNLSKRQAQKIKQQASDQTDNHNQPHANPNPKTEKLSAPSAPARDKKSDLQRQ